MPCCRVFVVFHDACGCNRTTVCGAWLLFSMVYAGITVCAAVASCTSATLYAFCLQMDVESEKASTCYCSSSLGVLVRFTIVSKGNFMCGERLNCI